jgi:C-terminal processing protease CtpA/Prc
MGRVPRVIRIGENTQGLFSDVLERRLPNGWIIYLSNEVFRTEDGKAFDGMGIPPDVRVPVFADSDIIAKRDARPRCCPRQACAQFAMNLDVTQLD